MQAVGKKRKTRQEKIIADLRKQIASQDREEGLSRYEPKPKNEGEEKTKISSNSTLSNNLQPAIDLSPISNAYIKKDLTKTFILSILAFSLEFVIYFLTG